MATGSYWSDINSPKPVLQVGSTSGQSGQVEMSDFVVGTQGSVPGAVLIEWNLASPSGSPSGMWDVHTRIGGFAGSNLQVAQCAKNPGSSTVVSACVAAYMSMHVTSGAAGLYMENTWLWVADHDIEDPSNAQITVYAGRGLLIESKAGPVWLVGTAVEHHVLYNYQFVGASNIFGSEFQTETPYYQPTPNALVPFPVNTALHDPDFSASCTNVAGNCAESWGLRVVDTSNLLVYGAGHYSFFSSYSTSKSFRPPLHTRLPYLSVRVTDQLLPTACSTIAAGETCQSRIVSLEGTISNVNIYNLNTIGSLSMINRDGTSLASWSDNVNTFAANIAVFKSG